MHNWSRIGNTYRKPRTAGPNISIVASDHGVLDHFGADELVVHITLPGHDDGGGGGGDGGGEDVRLSASWS